MVRVSSPAKLRPWSELSAKMVMGVVPGLLNIRIQWNAGTACVSECVAKNASVSGFACRPFKARQLKTGLGLV